ncbi:hypothetical protein [Herbidospora daliensis]|uniref:hypothetical protein n=1 Tax=Herbidospora daliensis TaxID=295585 RepID=UPI0007807D9C|nr:hypothetical protein [Herbidospora daliensis]
MSRPRRSFVAGAALTLLTGLAVAAAPPAAASDHRSLTTWYHWGRQDNFSAATTTQDSAAEAAGYELIRREEAWVLSRRTGDSATQRPLYLYYSSARGDNVSAAHPETVAAAVSAGYTYQGLQGYVWTTRQPGTVPLYQYWHPGRGDNFAAASPQGIAAAVGAGYVRVRVEGYVYPGTAF